MFAKSDPLCRVGDNFGFYWFFFSIHLSFILKITSFLLGGVSYVGDPTIIFRVQLPNNVLRSFVAFSGDFYKYRLPRGPFAVPDGFSLNTNSPRGMKKISSLTSL